MSLSLKSASGHDLIKSKETLADRMAKRQVAMQARRAVELAKEAAHAEKEKKRVLAIAEKRGINSEQVLLGEVVHGLVDEVDFGCYDIDLQIETWEVDDDRLVIEIEDGNKYYVDLRIHKLEEDESATAARAALKRKREQEAEDEDIDDDSEEEYDTKKPCFDD